MGVILLRHTRPDGAAGLCYGRSDLGLAGTFEAEADAVLAALPQPARIVSSPLSRCLRLAERIASVHGVTLERDDRLREMDFGRWEGRPWADIPRAELDAWAADFLTARPHGGESVALLAARVAAALADLAGPGPVCVVTHSGVIRAALAARDGPEGWRADIAFGAIVPL
ncbi:MAG: alpha-ribazole phosphatase [Alphaproteobacteria bacterium]|nr:alpha-ribazole phosphatase [Alphaproteobacteria bacterium]